MQIAAVILAGGEARRLGGADKALLHLCGRPLLAHVLDRLRPQIDVIALSANGDPARFAAFDVPVLADDEIGQGPLAGVLAGLDWAAAQGFDAILTAPVDTPFLPADLVAKLVRASDDAARPSVAISGERLHPTVALWPVAQRATLRTALGAGERRLRMPLQGAVQVTFDGPTDPFKNLNTLDDFRAAEAAFCADKS